MLNTKIISSNEKVFLDDSFDSFERLEKISALKGERLCFQLIAKASADCHGFRHYGLSLDGELAKYATVRKVESVPVTNPVSTPDFSPYDDNYLRTKPGVYPDVLSPITEDKRVFFSHILLYSLWIEVDIPKVCTEIGESRLTVTLEDSNGAKYTDGISVKVIDAVLPDQKLLLTQWFHCDCLASYYNVPVWSEEHWRIVENFARTARANGINLLLTPVFTPPLDTEVGGERLTNQLVKVTKRGDRYYFGYSLLDRWIDMCDRVGIEYFEISHLFTQWGAKHAPKVMATVDGEYKRIFGWDIDATGEEYTYFLRSFIKSFLKHMKKRGDDKRCYFHISDEPSLEHLENYKAAKAVVEDLLEGYTMMDALSSYDFWTKGICQTPIPVNDRIQEFIDGKVPNLWTYYCCGQCVNVSNRLVAMPSWRNRSIGMQLYKYDIVGFLQWGYNFYNNCRSRGTVNPYNDISGTNWVPAGDPFSVYPAADGTAYESLRIVVFTEALQDLRAMQLCESYYSKEEVVCELEKILGCEIRFDRCAKSAKTVHAMRERINEMIDKAIKA